MTTPAPLDPNELTVLSQSEPIFNSVATVVREDEEDDVRRYIPAMIVHARRLGLPYLTAKHLGLDKQVFILDLPQDQPRMFINPSVEGSGERRNYLVPMLVHGGAIVNENMHLQSDVLIHAANLKGQFILSTKKPPFIANQRLQDNLVSCSQFCSGLLDGVFGGTYLG